MNFTHTVYLTEEYATVDGKKIAITSLGLPMLKALYHEYVGDYPKFYKMDPLCQLGFIASELLLNAEAEAGGRERFVPCEDRAVVLVGRSASVCADNIYQRSICDRSDFYPSPSAFIYTLPNIVTGEIAIRNHYYGETSYYVQDSPETVRQLMVQAICSRGTQSVLGGWIDMKDTTHFEATLYI
ncbi:MAG: 3-oxoacyl-ACP synthase, partial [Paraprevotella sp.]|nr:3-oxoacyl-ACP synthase [Paraprevotella sp.]